jgi:hypothetical protein
MAGRARPAAQAAAARRAAYELPDDGNEDFCGACGRTGTLLCCDLCPAAFHFDCAGYGASPALAQVFNHVWQGARLAYSSATCSSTA